MTFSAGELASTRDISMEPRTSPSVVRKSRDSLPFYELPQERAHLIPAKIVSEARNAIVEKPGLRVINTRRPETPREEQRKLFGEQSVRDPTNRPPSAFRYLLQLASFSPVFC